MKRALFFLAAITLVAFLVPGLGGRRGVAVAATPTPAALQYDEINRMVIPPATPPAPGTFQDDYKAVVAAASSGGQQPHGGGLSGMIGAMMHNPEGMMSAMTVGHLTRYTYYKGWIRTDDPVAQTATIEKCAEHQFITLNLANKTYTISNTQPPCPSPMTPMGRPMHGAPEKQEPGTVDMTVKASGQNLGPLTIDTIPTTGSQGDVSMSMTNATGSCRDGQFGMNVTSYVSQIATPRAYCPLPRTMTASAPEMMASQGGCKPTMHADVAGGSFFSGEGTHLVMYRRSSMSAGAGENSRMSGMNMVMERGNVKWLSGADADALFAVPAGFTQAGG